MSLVDHAAAREALAGVTARTVQLLGGVPDGDAPVVGSEWTAAEVGAHLVVALRAFTAATQGDFEEIAAHIPDVDSFSERLAAVTAATLALEPERDPRALAAMLARASTDFLAVTDGMPGDLVVPTPWYGTTASLRLDAATALLLGEQLVHCYDVASTFARPWTIAPADARLVVGAVASMLPLAVDPVAAEGMRAAFDLRVRGGLRLAVVVADGSVTIRPGPPPGPVDCHLSVDPVAFVLVGYGRVSQWGPVARGAMVAWGRRPWMGLRFKSLFVNP